jgi:NAD(P)H-dependent FMN reductase
VDTTVLRVALIVASTRPQRVADLLRPWLEPALRQRDWLTLEVVDLAGTVLPVDLPPGGAASPVSGVLSAADAFVVLAPEYNHGYPAALKHLIDCHHGEWAYKPVTFVAYGAGSGGIRAVEQLRQVFPEVRATTTRNVVALVAPWQNVDGAGSFRPPPGTDQALDRTLRELRWWAETLRDGRRSRPLP